MRKQQLCDKPGDIRICVLFTEATIICSIPHVVNGKHICKLVLTLLQIQDAIPVLASLKLCFSLRFHLFFCCFVTMQICVRFALWCVLPIRKLN